MVQSPPSTVFDLLREDLVDMAVLKGRYWSQLTAVRHLIGVAPNCDKAMEIWPASFETYNLIVPTFLNLPATYFGMSTPFDLLSFALLYSSIGSDCPYCTLHCCSFAMARGVPAKHILKEQHLDELPEREGAVARFGIAIGKVPAQVTHSDRELLRSQFSPVDCECIVMATAMMGFLNKFMDAVGVDMERTTVDEVGDILKERIEWGVGKHTVAEAELMQKPSAKKRVDTVGSKLTLLPHAPALMRYEKRHTSGVPTKWPAVGEHLYKQTGFRFSILSHLRSTRTVPAIASLLCKNLGASCKLPLSLKHLVAVVFAAVSQNSALHDDFASLAAKSGASAATIAAAEAFGRTPINTQDALSIFRGGVAKCLPGAAVNGELDLMALILAKLSASSPTILPSDLLPFVKDVMTSAQIVELFTWISVLAMLQRLYVFYMPDSYPAPKSNGA